jgi:uncharacterized protein YfaS (alpha-2-macroglobulin family)
MRLFGPAPASRLAWLLLASLAGWLGNAAVAEAVDYVSYEVAAEQNAPRVCFSFTGALLRQPGDQLRSYVTVTPPVDAGFAVRQKDLCVTGLEHGTSYDFQLRQGLRAEDGTSLGQTIDVAVRVPDRMPRVSFRKGGYVLPLGGDGGLPLQSVNVERATLEVYRIGERNLLAQLSDGFFGDNLSGWSRERIADEAGARVFRGEVAIDGTRNQEVTTALPTAELLGALEAGLYVIVAAPKGEVVEDWQQQATQWFTVSDLGLSTLQGDDGLTVIARSLQSALPTPGVTLRLVARNNEVLASADTDTEGRAHFAGGLMRGEGGNAPRALYASGPAGDFTFLDLQGQALDLVDQGVDGRAPPGPLDAFAYTERGIYRPGETVHLAVLLRDDLAHAVTGVPLTLKLLRPDAVEADTLTLQPGSAGGGTIDIPIAGSAFTGQWTVNVMAGAGGPTIGSTTFLVDDFVPPRIELGMAFDHPVLHAGDPLGVTLDASYLYGAPAADLNGELELVVQAATTPFAAFPDYSFGLVQEPFLPQRVDPRPIRTDAAGKAAASLPLDLDLDTTQPLEAEVRGRVFDIDGRPVQTSRTLPLRLLPAYVGIRPAFAEALPADSEAGFDILLLDADGKALPGRRLAWELVREDYDYVWFERYGQWDYDTVVLDNRLQAGELAVDAEGRGHVAVPVGSGRYRLEVYDQGTSAATSYRFTAGWWATAGTAGEKPDAVQVRIDAATATSGTVRAFVKPPYPARVLLALADSEVRELTEVEIPAAGRIVELTGWQPRPGGSYLLATAYAATGVVRPQLPARAVGAAWIPGEQAAERLAVQLEAPSQVLPQTTMKVGIAVDGLGAGNPAFVTLAAVDAGILQLTAYDPPDPATWYLGKRRLGLELRDIYGRLIDPSGRRGRIVSGGDARARLQLGGLDLRSSRTVALFQGPIALDSAGHAEVTLDIPDFNGRLRLMAVAWSADRVGGADARTIVRPPVIADLTLPRFLAPGDRADLRLRLTNLDGPAGAYRVSLAPSGAIGLDRTEVAIAELTPNQPVDQSLTLSAGDLPGSGGIALAVDGPDGFHLDRQFEIAVRAARPYETRRQLALLPAGQSLTIDRALIADMVPGSAEATLTVAAHPSFDVAGLLHEVERYPYGCSEQLASKGLPLLFSSALEPDLPPDEAGRRAAMESDVLRRLTSLQAARGGFAVWSPLGAEEFWLTAYIGDFLLLARERGVHVPEATLDRTLDWLAARWSRIDGTAPDITAGAYAGLVLTRARRLDLSNVRYFADRFATRLPTPLARAQLAATLAELGDSGRAEAVFAAAGTASRAPDIGYSDHGSELRDEAGVISVAAEAGLLSPAELLPLGDRLAQRLAATRWTSTQERAWVVRAAAALTAIGGTMHLTIDGHDLPGDTQSIERTLHFTGDDMRTTVRNLGDHPAYRALTTTGVPLSPASAAADGFSIERRIYRPDGAPADLAGLRQNDQLMVVIAGRVTAGGSHRALVVNLLPAGIELENVRFAGTPSLEEFAWLGELTTPVNIELRDDRYVAAVDLDGDNPAFRLAYLARAVTPGSFVAPGAAVEDMYQPYLFAREASGRLAIGGR